MFNSAVNRAEHIWVLLAGFGLLGVGFGWIGTVWVGLDCSGSVWLGLAYFGLV